MKVTRQIKVYDDFAIVPLTRGFEAIIDAADAELVGRFLWCASVVKDGCIYAKRGERDAAGVLRTIKLHRWLIDAPSHLMVDHIDRNTLNNRRSNLRLATIAQNNLNTGIRKDNSSGAKGVSFHRGVGRWTSQISIGRKIQYLGCFDTQEAAALAYSAAAQRLHGEFVGRLA